MFILIGMCRKCWCSLKKIPEKYGTSNQVAIPYDDLIALENNTKAEIDKIFQDKLVIKVKKKKKKAVYSSALVVDRGGEEGRT